MFVLYTIKNTAVRREVRKFIQDFNIKILRRRYNGSQGTKLKYLFFKPRNGLVVKVSEVVLLENISKQVW